MDDTPSLEEWLLTLPRWIKRVLRKEARKAAYRDPLDETTGYLGPIAFTYREMMESMLVIGGKGSGKTSCMAWLLYYLYASGWCGHILTVKTEEFAHQIKLLKSRHADVIVIGPAMSMAVGDETAPAATINAIAYEYVESGESIEAVAQLCGTLMELVEGHGGKSSDAKGRFFERSALNAVRMATALLSPLGTEYLNFVYLADVIKTAPTDPEAHPDGTLFWLVADQVKGILATLPAAKREDANRAFDYFTGQWARLAEETRSSIIATLSSMTELFSLSPLREMFCEETTVRPRDCWERRKILIHAATIHGNGINGKIQQAIWKYLFMRDAERRIPTADDVPCFQIEDEFQETILKTYDCQFHGISRSKLICNIVMTQTLSSIHTALGNKHESDTLIANLRNRAIFSSDDPETTKAASEWMGQTTRILPGPPQASGDSLDIWRNFQPGNWHSQRGPEIEPAEFGRLLKGGPPHWCAEAVIYKGGADMGRGRVWDRVKAPQWRHSDGDEHQ